MFQHSFNLIDEPWIPVVDDEGRTREVGLEELFTSSHTLRALADSSPLSLFSMLRLLLVVAHRIVEGPTGLGHWKKIWHAGRFDENAVKAYFERWRHRFDLFDPEWPFLQVGGFETVTKNVISKSPISRLLPELATGNNPTLFDHSFEEHPKPMSGSECARALLVAQTFGLGGGKGPTSRRPGQPIFTHPYSSHAPGAGAVAVWVRRDTLYATLVANLVWLKPDRAPPHCSDSNDKPTWERDTLRGPTEATPTGYLEVCTWPARYVRVLPEADGRVREMCFAQGAIIAQDSGFDNPFAFFEVDDKRGKVPVPLNPERAVWRDSSALFAVAGKNAKSIPPEAVRVLRDGRVADLQTTSGIIDLVCVGLANDKANPLLWRTEIIPTPVRLIEDPDTVALLEACLADVEAVWQVLRGATRSLAYALLETDTKAPDTKEVTRVQDRMLRRVGYWERMDHAFRAFMVGLDEPARLAWRQAARRAAYDGLKRAADFVEGNVARVGRALSKADRKLAMELAKLEPKSPVTDSTPSSSSPQEAS